MPWLLTSPLRQQPWCGLLWMKDAKILSFLNGGSISLTFFFITINYRWKFNFAPIKIPKCDITMTSNERHGVSTHRQIVYLYSCLFRLTLKKHQSPHYWTFLRGMHRGPVDSRHKGSVTRKQFDDVIMTRQWCSRVMCKISNDIITKNWITAKQFFRRTWIGVSEMTATTPDVSVSKNARTCEYFFLCFLK